MRVLDLFTGAGGAYRGYVDAGFDVVGVDIADQPDHPGEWRKREVLGFLDNQAEWWLRRFNLIDVLNPMPGLHRAPEGHERPAGQDVPDAVRPGAGTPGAARHPVCHREPQGQG